jgi:hypothetical protein
MQLVNPDFYEKNNNWIYKMTQVSELNLGDIYIGPKY